MASQATLIHEKLHFIDNKMLAKKLPFFLKNINCIIKLFVRSGKTDIFLVDTPQMPSPEPNFILEWRCRHSSSLSKRRSQLYFKQRNNNNRIMCTCKDASTFKTVPDCGMTPPKLLCAIFLGNDRGICFGGNYFFPTHLDFCFMVVC